MGTIESNVADIKCILTNDDTETKDDGHQSPPENGQPPPDYIGGPPSDRHTYNSHPSMPFGPLPSNPPSPSSPPPQSQTFSLTFQTHSQAYNAKKGKNLSSAYTDADTDVNVEHIPDQSDVDDGVYFMDLLFIDEKPLHTVFPDSHDDDGVYFMDLSFMKFHNTWGLTTHYKIFT
ncbi:unnamed protein product [Lactuca virosa]|uniref:Uncharacterized protein n=1 Tax=Lactuca virosa TaxID=75947 RepID=A0AAU9LQL5_9ASTR|nr:unnamed protein product [Lactuca virosa]